MAHKSTADTATQLLREKAARQLESDSQQNRREQFQDPDLVRQELEIHQIELEMQNEELRRAQQELALSRDRYLELYHQAPVGYVIADAAGIVLQANETFGNMLWADLASIRYQPLTKYIREADKNQFLSRYRSFFKSPAGKHLEIGLTRADGSVLAVKLTGRKMAGDGALSQDKVLAGQLLITISDITSRKKAEKAIIRAKQEWEQTFDAVPDLIAIIDGEGVIQRVNRAFAASMGLPPEACINRSCEHLLKDRDFVSDVQVVKRLIHNRERAEAEVYHEKRQAYYIISASPFQDRSGSDIWRILLFHDVTANRKAQQEIAKGRNLESIGALAGGIAHDFNNLLVGIVGNIELAQVGDGNTAAGFLEKALDATERAKELTGRLLTFSKGGTPRARPTEIAPLVQAALSPNFEAMNIGTDIQIPENLHPIFADGVQIKNVLQSIVSNAAEAMPSGGRLVVAARNVAVGEHNGRPLKPGPHVVIKVRDWGGGIAADDLDKVFDPYFTTKRMGAEKGMGLGLAVSHSIVKQHGGHISIRSWPGGGTEVNLYLPAAVEKKAPVREPFISRPQSRPIAATPPRFLVMEDETTLWDMLAQLFDSIESHADFAADAEEAMRLFQEAKASGSPYHGLFLDLMIRGGKGGKEVIQEVLAIDPNARAVAFSGYTTDPVFSDHRKFGFLATLKKPFHLADFKNVAQRLISDDGH